MTKIGATQPSEHNKRPHRVTFFRRFEPISKMCPTFCKSKRKNKVRISFNWAFKYCPYSPSLISIDECWKEWPKVRACANQQQNHRQQTLEIEQSALQIKITWALIRCQCNVEFLYKPFFFSLDLKASKELKRTTKILCDRILIYQMTCKQM